MRTLLVLLGGFFVTTTANLSAGQAQRNPLDPKGAIHIPIGVANTVDTLKTFVEAEGCFSPGVGTYGIYFWVFDPQGRKLTAPTQAGVKCERGLSGAGWLMPWSAWDAGGTGVRTEVCEVERASPQGEVFVVAARVQLHNTGKDETRIALYAALRPLGPSGGPVKELAVAETGDALLVDGHAAVVANERPSGAGVAANDSIGETAAAGKLPDEKKASSPSGDCSGALRFDVTLAPGQKKTLGFICPVLPGRRAVGHRWDGVSKWAQLDLNKPNPAEGGILQPDPGLEYYRSLKADALFDEAAAYWKDLVGRATIKLPDPRWAECFAAITGHAAMCMNEGAPDVSVVNYNVFNRDGVYVANILQKSGRYDLAEEAIDYFLRHPFNGRVQVEADNPGQVLWVMGEHWLFTRDRKWLERVYPAAAKIAGLIRYCRTTPEPHYVKATSLEFGDSLPPDKPDDLPAHKRQVLKPGACDGFNPNYTEAFDVAGVRAAAMLAEAIGQKEDADAWSKLAASLFESYDKRFGAKLGAGYGSYSVLWPCRLYPCNEGKGFGQFRDVGVQKPTGWRYFPLATAHQGLLAGNRDAGHKTLALHLDHEQMRAWYAFDEGGDSGAGGWPHVRTTWKGAVAMPHGWAIAETHLLLRDSLLFEDGEKLVLLAGVPPEWFTHADGMSIANLPTHFGPCSFAYTAAGPPRSGADLTISGKAEPPAGFVLRLPKELQATVKADGAAIPRAENGECLLPGKTRKVEIKFAK
ncbi:MAG: hypothetical protein NTW87_21945 [Planctomycetota bacterium]|nr:hypothetical protein [Planctomycetota bacterium]